MAVVHTGRKVLEASDIVGTGSIVAKGKSKIKTEKVVKEGVFPTSFKAEGTTVCLRSTFHPTFYHPCMVTEESDGMTTYTARAGSRFIQVTVSSKYKPEIGDVFIRPHDDTEEAFMLSAEEFEAIMRPANFYM